MTSSVLKLARLGLIAGLGLSPSLGLSLPALAGGAGTYAVKGNNGEKGTDYTGTLVITQTSKDTFKLSWNIGGDKYDGFAVGDARILAASFVSDGSSGAALLVDDEAGGYKSIWAFKGETKLGVEMITPKK
ncbi:hypothetical protein [Methylobacterium trifolii]|uniref:Uncharacterized protein n=1 Tax=Methylobacterium trifolii TaxID=1003092 RepID=A0ABQ4U2G9_9HYPH|nr:hypothetical protein [Methylobacterium trifolii]GJE61173.1 hypothetical protein MPOCJGCO_3294 [Methylobacterium trifolii]